MTTAGETGPTIWVDDDATPRPIKEVLFKTSMRRGTPLVLVSNRWTQPPKSGNVRCIQVEQGADVADDTIVELVQRGDLVITNDIPLAARVVGMDGERITLELAAETLAAEPLGGVIFRPGLYPGLFESR